jgi:hypothetical protein
MTKKSVSKSRHPVRTARSSGGKKAAPKSAARRSTPSRSENQTRTGEIFRAIVDSVLQQRKVFTSEDIMMQSNSSPRHSRRTLAFLVQNNALKVDREERPYRYQIASREQLKRFTK